MFLPRDSRLLRPTLHPPNRRACSSVHPNIPVDFVAIASMAAAPPSASTFPATPYRPKYAAWPYTASDFQRHDEAADGVFYQQARLVTHIDDPAIARLTQYYDAVLPRAGTIMDMCTSWKSFYPVGVTEAVQRRQVEVFGVGLNAAEMRRNGVFRDAGHWRVGDLNRAPYDVRAAWEGMEMRFDAVTCVVSIDYLKQPLEVCRNLLDATEAGGKVHLVVSNRCFPDKVVRRWMVLSELSRLELVGGEWSMFCIRRLD